MIRLLPYLGGVLVFIAFVICAVLVYRYVTKDTRIGPKRELAKQVERLRIEQACQDKLLEDLVDVANTWKPDAPVLADLVIIRITTYKSERALRTKELTR